MKIKVRILILSIFVMSVLLIQTAAFADAYYIPPGGTRYTYTAIGYVYAGASPIQYATVQLYSDTMTYVGSTSTNAYGYFSKSVTVVGHAVDFLIAKVTKSGYNPKTAVSSRPQNGVCNFGTIQLTAPPAEPVINQVHETGEGMDNGVEYFVTWGSGSTQYEVTFYWSADSVFDEGDILGTPHTNGSGYYHETPLPMSWTDSEYWFKITARSKGAGGWSPTKIYGPQVLELKYYPTDDAVLDGRLPGTIINNDDLIVSYESDNQGAHEIDSILKFSIPNPAAVKRVSLKLWSRSLFPDGHGGIDVFKMTNETWEEETVCWNYFQTIWHSELFGDRISGDYTGNVGDWDVWDVTTAAETDGSFALILVVWVPVSPYQGSEYYSKDYWNRARWPHIVVEYWGAPESPHVSSGFHSDTFSSPINQNWDIEIHNSPNSWYSFGYGNNEIEDGGCLAFYGDAATNPAGYDFIQDSFSSENDFCFRAKIGWYNNLDTRNYWAYRDLGIQLKDVNGSNLAYIKHTYEGAYYGLKARVGSNNVEYVPLDYMRQTHYVYLEFRRYFGNDGHWRMRLSWRYVDTFDSEVIVDQPVSSNAATQMRIWCYTWDGIVGDYPPTAFDGYVDSVKEVSTDTISLWEDNGVIGDFQEPIKNSGFDTVKPGTNIPQNWTDVDGNDPSAEISND
ncbi:MAG: hypothetical protein ACFFCP_07155, partial [Promethearchaeota archaeon]